MTGTAFEGWLPFLVNGTLTPEDRAAALATVQDNRALRDDYEALCAIRAAMQATPVQSPGAFGLARLLREIDAETALADATAATAAANLAAQAAAARAAQAAAAQPLPPVPTPQVHPSRRWPVLAAVLLMVALGQGAMLLASRPAAEASLSVAFRADATEAEIRALLRDLRLQISAGPSDSGLYRLEGDGAPTARAALAQATGIVAAVAQ